MKKLMAIRKLISNIAITIMLIYFFIKTKNGKLVILPFLICSVSMFFKSIFVIIDKEKYIKLFAYIFVISFFVYYF